MKLKGYILAVVSAVSFGLIPLFVIPVKQMDFSLDLTLFYRFLFSALMILSILAWTCEKISFPVRDLFKYILLGFFYGLGSDSLFMAYDLLTPGIASTLFFIYPIFVAVSMSVFFNEKLSKLTLFSLFITLAGVYILSLKGSGFEINLKGMLIGSMAAVSYGIYILLVNQSGIGGSGWKTTFYSMVFASAYYVIKILITGQPFFVPQKELLFDFGLFAFVTTVISVSTLVYAIKLIGSTPTSILGALEPIVAVLVSIIMFGEAFTRNLFWGILLILVGVTLSIIGESKKQKTGPDPLS